VSRQVTYAKRLHEGAQVVMESEADWAAARSDKWRRQLAGMEAMLAPIDEPLVRALELDRPLRIADIGCGSGATAAEVLRRAPAGSRVHGFDLSPALVEIARRRHTAQDDVLAFDVADMQRATPPERPYDRMVSRLGVMFFDDAMAAFSNLRHWLDPGGRFVFAVWGPLADNAWMKEVRAVVAGVVDLPSTDPAAPGPFRYGDALRLTSVLEQAGFADVAVTDWRGLLPVGGHVAAPAAARFALDSFLVVCGVPVERRSRRHEPGTRHAHRTSCRIRARGSCDDERPRSHRVRPTGPRLMRWP
jgi:SAM-dependent methyltransferase